MKLFFCCLFRPNSNEQIFIYIKIILQFYDKKEIPEDFNLFNIISINKYQIY